MESVTRLNKDLKEAAVIMSDTEIRYLVDQYYAIQEYRKATGNQIRAMEELAEPSKVIEWFFDNTRVLENQIKNALQVYADSKLLGRWCQSIRGIGPVLTSGLMAHIDATKPHVSHVWNFAGLNPNIEWKKGKKRPWNARLKVLAWKIGESFVKVSNHPNDIYGKIYKARKELEIKRNEAGEFAGQAEDKLAKFKIGKDTIAYSHYSKGRLPDGHIHERAKRYAVKIFLSHYHAVAHEIATGEVPAKPYVIEHMGHADYIHPPNWPMA